VVKKIKWEKVGNAGKSWEEMGKNTIRTGKNRASEPPFPTFARLRPASAHWFQAPLGAPAVGTTWDMAAFASF